MELPTYTKQWHNDVYPDIDASRPELSAKGKRVVITGGAGGIGGATAEAFAVAGAAEVIIMGRTQRTLDATKAAISSRHPDVSVVAIVCDVANSESVDKAFTSIASRGRIDIFINNAGYIATGDVATQDANSWWSVYEINVKGSLFATQAALKNISPQDGTIINVSSAACHVPFVPKYSAYSTSKIAFAKAFEYLHYELPNLKVFNVQPGIIESTGVASTATSETGMSFPQQDTVELPGNFMVWLCSPEGLFLRGRFVWVNWDVKELMDKKEALQKDPTMLTLGLLGWPQ